MDSDSSDVEINEGLMPRPDFLGDDSTENEDSLAINQLETQEELEQRLVDKEHENKLLTERNQFLQENFDSLETELQTLRSQLIAEKHEGNMPDIGLQKEVMQMEQSVGFLQQENATLKAKTEYEEGEVARLNTQLSAIQTKQAENEQQHQLALKKAEESEQKLEEQREQQSILIESLEVQIKQFEAASKDSDAQLRSKTQAYDDLVYKLQEVESDISVKDVHIEKLVYELDQEKAEAHKLQLKLELASSGSDELMQINQNKLAVLRKQLEENESEMQAAARKSKQELRERDQIIDQQQVEIAQFEAVLQRAKSELADSEAKMQLYMRELQEKATTAVEERDEQLRQQADIQQLQKENQQLRATLSPQDVAKSTRDPVNSSARSIVFLKTELSGAKIENFELKSRVEQLENELSRQSIHRSVHDAAAGQIENERLRAQLTELPGLRALIQEETNQLADLRMAVSEYELKITDMTQKLATAAESTEQSEQIIQSKNEQIQELTNNLDDLFAQNEAALEAQTQQFQSILDENLGLKNELEATRKRAEAAEHTAEALERQAQIRDEQALSRDAELQAERETLALAQSEKKELERARTELAESKQYLQQLESRAKGLENDAAELAALRTEFQEVVSRAADAEKARAELQSTVDALQNEIAAQHERYEELEEMAHEAEADLLTQQHEAEELRNAIAQANKQQESDIESAKNALQDAKRELTAVKADYRQLENELQQEKYKFAEQTQQFCEFKQEVQNQLKIVTENAQILQRENEKLRLIQTSLEDK